jgi:hypothetical protein
MAANGQKRSHFEPHQADLSEATLPAANIGNPIQSKKLVPTDGRKLRTR